jgi:hypothetical protein
LVIFSPFGRDQGIARAIEQRIPQEGHIEADVLLLCGAGEAQEGTAVPQSQVFSPVTG